MRFLLVFTLILLVFSLGIHTVVVQNISRLFGVPCPWRWIFLLVAFIATNFLAVMWQSALTWNTAVRLWFVLTMYYVGILWILFVVSLGYALLRGVMHFTAPLPPRVAQVLVIGSAVGLVAYGLAHARQVTVKTIEVSSAKLSAPLTLVQLTDLHLGALHGRSFVARLVAQTNALKPDLVALTGDFVDKGTTPEMLAEFAQLKAPAFFVWGNHDDFLSRDQVAQMFRKTPIRILTNEVVVFRDTMQIVGLDYLTRQPKPDPRPILTRLALRQTYFTLLLSHSPIDFDRLDGQPIDLQLAGHTHAGQIFPFDLLVRLFYPRFSGLYTSGTAALYVSSGTGTWGPPMRLGSQNELTVVRLLPQASGTPLFAARQLD
jgi:predicted MPP superfamily phosphohydrolase